MGIGLKRNYLIHSDWLHSVSAECGFKAANKSHIAWSA